MKKTPKLAFRPETLRQLTTDALARIVAGRLETTISVCAGSCRMFGCETEG